MMNKWELKVRLNCFHLSGQTHSTDLSSWFLVVSKGKTTRCSLDNVIAHYDILGVDSQTDAFQEGKVTVSVQSMMSIYKVPILCE